MQLIAWETSPK